MLINNNEIEHAHETARIDANQRHKRSNNLKLDQAMIYWISLSKYELMICLTLQQQHEE